MRVLQLNGKKLSIEIFIQLMLIVESRSDD
jgi:hypothetical protein